jgi:hypothetical protein
MSTTRLADGEWKAAGGMPANDSRGFLAGGKSQFPVENRSLFPGRVSDVTSHFRAR